jgi:hypothetical protein
MPTYFIEDCANLVIANGGTASNAVGPLDNIQAFVIYAPAALTGTVNVQESPDNVTFYDMKSAGSNVTVPVNGAVNLTAGGYKYIRVFSGSAEGAARTFRCAKQMLT